MNKLIMSTVAISMGFWAQFAYAGSYSDIGKSMTAEQLAAFNCTAGHMAGGCKNPLYWSIYDGYTPEDCTDWMVEPTCTSCKSGYVLEPYTCIPDNEQGTFYDACMPNAMTEDQKADAKFIYKCECSDLYSETGVKGYLFRGCNTGSIEYKCDASNKYYQSGTNIKCTVSTDSSGNFKFSRCSGCKLCDDSDEFWRNGNTGYQRAYRYRFVNGTTATCNDYDIDKWRCAAKYYGTSTNGVSGCTPCPTFEDVGLTEVCNQGACPYISSPAGATQITQCYAGTWEPDLLVYLKDSTGKFHWIPVDDTVNSYGECNYK